MKPYTEVASGDSVRNWLSVPGTDARFRIEDPMWKLNVERSGVRDVDLEQLTEAACVRTGDAITSGLALKIGDFIRDQLSPNAA